MGAAITRRTFLAALPILGQAAEVYPSQSKRLRDPATEFEITRLTDPTFNSWLIAPPGRSIGGRNNGLLYCSDRDGEVQAYRLDLKSGESRRLTSAAKLDRTTVGYLPDDRTVCDIEENALNASTGSRTRTIYEVEEGWQRTPAFTLTEDGNHALLVERKGNKRRLQMITIGRGAATTVTEADEEIAFVRPRPKRASILYARSQSLWLVDYTGQNARPLKTPAGTPAQALWSADGKSFTYLRIPENEAELNDLREHVPDSNEDKKIAATSQFVTFCRNADASVFAGVSRNKASPYILILLRVAHRELTVAEHRARNPKDVTVLFTPNSQRLLWHTDREGKSAIYTLAVERFVENTEPSEATNNSGDLSGFPAL
jgi:oligogalacturonide lyase